MIPFLSACFTELRAKGVCVSVGDPRAVRATCSFTSFSGKIYKRAHDRTTAKFSPAWADGTVRSKNKTHERGGGKDSPLIRAATSP